MSSARFLLEFEATGDQEVVNAIKEVGTAGKETAADLDALKNIEDPFSSLSEGADSAVAPIQEVGSAATDTVTPLQDMGSATEELGGIFGEAGTSTADFSANMDAVGGAADATVGGLTDANTAVGDFGTSATTAGETTGSMGKSVTTAAGAVAALGGTIGSAVGSLFRYQDIQLKLQKAQAASARATETHRKAEAGLDAVLKTATGNAAGIAAARQRLADAQAKVNELMDAGVTSGAEYEAAQAELQAAQAALNKEFAKGGGDVAKLTTAMEKSESSAAKMVIATNNLEKATRTAQMGIMDMVFGFAGLAGSIVQTTNQMKSFGLVLKALPLAAIGTALGAAGAAVAVFMGAVIALNKAPYDQIIGQLDKIGKKVGEVFPPVTDSLTKLGDQMGSSLDFLAGYSRGLVKQLTGVSLQADVTKKSFSELVQLFLKDGTTGYTQINRAIAGYVDAARAQGMTDKEIIELAKKHNDENKKLAASTTEMGGAMASTINYGEGLNSMLVNTNDGLSSVGSTVIKVGGSFVELHGTLTDLGNGYSEINGQIIKNSDILNKTGLSTDKAAESAKKLQANWQDVTATAADMQSATATLNTTLQQNIDKNYEQAHAILSLIDSEQNHTEAISAVNLAYAQSQDAVADMNAVLGDQTAHQEAVGTAINKTIESVKGEQIALEAAIAATQNKVIQDQKLTNAKLEGTKAAMEFISSLDEEKASQEANIAVLRQSVAAMGVFGNATIQSADQLEQFAAVAAGVPSAIRELAGEIGGLAQEATKFLEFAGEEDELFGNWKVADTVPNEIKAMMSDADLAFIQGQAQLERTMESLGPLTGVKFAKAIATAKQGGLGELRSFGTEAAAMLREGFPTMDAALRELTDSFAIMGTAADKDMIPAMQRVITAMQNVEDPAASLTKQMLDLQQKTGASAAPLLSVAGGLEQLSAAGADATVKLSEIPLVKITDDAGNAVAEFANFGGQLVPIGPAAQGAATGLGAMTNAVNPLNSAIQLAGTTIQQFSDYVVKAFTQDIPNAINSAQNMRNPLEGMINVAITSVDQLVKSVNEKISGIKPSVNINPFTGMISVAITSVNQMVSKINQSIASVKQTSIPTFTVNVAPALAQLNKIRTALGGVKSGQAGINLNPAPALAAIKKVIGEMAKIRQGKVPQIQLNISPAVSAANKIRSIVNALPHIKRTITYTYRVVGSRPNPPNLNKTITYRYRTVGSRPAQTGMHENLSEDTMIAAHAGERVDITPNTINTNEERVALVPAGARKGGAEYVIPVTLMLDNKVLVRTVSRGLMEDVGGVA